MANDESENEQAEISSTVAWKYRVWDIEQAFSRSAWSSHVEPDRSIKTTHAVLSSMLKHAVELGVIKTNPVRDVKPESSPSGRRKALTYYTQHQLAQLLPVLVSIRPVTSLLLLFSFIPPSGYGMVNVESCRLFVVFQYGTHGSRGSKYAS